MSSFDFDDNIAEIRGIQQSTSERPVQAQTDPENQPLLLTSSDSPVTTDTRGNSFVSSAAMFFTFSTIYGGTAVMLGAFGAHGLKKRISDPSRIANWSTAAQYQLMHSVALLATSIALPARAQRIPGGLFVAGMTMFSGSIYLLVLDPQKFKALGPVTPLGGLCLIGGWISLGVIGRRFVR